MVPNDIIFALSSGPPPCAIGVIRITGNHCLTVLETMIGTSLVPRRATLVSLKETSGGTMLDRCIALYFASPHSFTGEDCIELHCHGSLATLSAVLTALGKIKGVREAECGEFTRRAFLNNKMDLTAVEGLSDLINARTEAQRKQALDLTSGVLRTLYDGWRHSLVSQRASLEASLDFSDEDSVPDSLRESVWTQTQTLLNSVNHHLENRNYGEIVRNGFRIALLGPPNAGKSSLLNALAKKELAIVTPIPGTTRDILETSLDIDGYLVTISDTAGIRETNDLVEAEGVKRAYRVARSADLVLWLNPADAPEPVPESVTALELISKADLFNREKAKENLCVDTISRDGLNSLIFFISEQIKKYQSGSEHIYLTRERHRRVIESVSQHLVKSLDRNHPPEIHSEELRLASDSLGKLTGSIEVEELLDFIFSEFCIGK